MKKVICLFICIIATLFGTVSASESKFVVVIDAGHGGKDGGAVRGTYKEKDINLGVAKILGELIESNLKDVKVVYTRKTDVFVDLDKRAQIANKAKANLFISIHTNSTAAKTTNAAGADTYILGLARSAENLEVAKRENSVILLEDDYTTKYEGFDPNSPESYIIFEFMSNKYMEQSYQFADLIQKDFKSIAKRNDRGVRQAGFLVLRKTSMPSVLIELGFINNSTEGAYLTTRLGQRAMATSIYSAFKKYKREFDKKQGRFISVELEKDVVIEEVTKEDDLAEINVVTDVATTRDININREVYGIQNTEEKKTNISHNQIEYRIQFLVSTKKLPENSLQFKGLSPVDYYKDGSSYKYTYGSESSMDQISKVQTQVRKKFKDAFIVKFRNGERIK